MAEKDKKKDEKQDKPQESKIETRTEAEGTARRSSQAKTGPSSTRAGSKSSNDEKVASEGTVKPAGEGSETTLEVARRNRQHAYDEARATDNSWASERASFGAGNEPGKVAENPLAEAKSESGGDPVEDAVLAEAGAVSVTSPMRKKEKYAGANRAGTPYEEALKQESSTIRADANPGNSHVPVEGESK